MKIKVYILIFVFLITSCKLKKEPIIGSQTMEFYDTHRDNRPLKVEIWYPTDLQQVENNYIPELIWQHPVIARDASISEKVKKFPLIIYSHGYLGDRLEPWLPKYLAQQGFITVTVDHFGNTWSNKIDTISQQPWQRALDISFILTALQQTPLQEKIDTDRIGLAGFSQGGWTGLLLAGAHIDLPYTDDDYLAPYKGTNSYKDERIKSFFLLAPGLGRVQLFSPDTLATLNNPIFIVTGSHDSITVPENNALYFAKHLPYAHLVVIPNADHWQFISVPTSFGIEQLTQSGNKRFIEDPRTINRKALHDEVGLQAIKFFKETL